MKFPGPQVKDKAGKLRAGLGTRSGTKEPERLNGQREAPAWGQGAEPECPGRSQYRRPGARLEGEGGATERDPAHQSHWGACLELLRTEPARDAESR